ncbi:uncharacterized protein ColSpa_12347 [Colletotrichum spaethianum]|uniref:Uncharacterized protein n=1 Tax=Colletotrichum spaethianum TaxID=700344 RepID=A0AA37PH10_9PEZI|nr:uncharacterized protein ColSpa_12347 [Colletotrichum spaethianum]GKT52166.1 hypothetical protein ColSpa_12347 [Colletotrichum spaethianum]
MSSTPEYQPFLKYSDDPTAEEPTSPKRHASRRNTFLSHVFVLVGTSLLWLVIFFLVYPSSTTTTSTQVAASSGLPETHVAGERHNVTSGRKKISCGSTTQEARANGCKYDILLNHWVPALCFDKESVDEYQEDGSWGAFADMNMTQRLTVDEMSERDFYWTSIRDHINHCAIMWRRQFYAFYDERAAIDSIITSPGHTEHCSQYLMDVVDAKWKEPTKTMRGFAGCWIRE